MTLNPELVLAQQLSPKPVYHIKDLSSVAGSRSTAYRLLEELTNLGFASRPKRGLFFLRDSIFQPFNLWPHLLPSLLALKSARQFGKNYSKADNGTARGLLPDRIETLDFKAWELTKFQTPLNFYLYVHNVDAAANILRNNGFSEGVKGKVVLLPIASGGDFSNQFQRTYLDCLSAGGRSNLDAAAIELIHGPKFKIKGLFPIEQIQKVREDIMP